jgi:small conductance mechanosensitive channel
MFENILHDIQNLSYRFERLLYKNFRIDNETFYFIIIVGFVTWVISQLSKYIFKKLSEKSGENLTRKDWFDFLHDTISYIAFAVFVFVFASSIPFTNRYLTAVQIVLAAFLLQKVIKFYIDKQLQRLEDNDDRTKFSFLQNALDLLVFIIAGFAVIASIPQLRSFAVTLFASAGIFAAFIGLASQKAFANLVSGTFIVIFKPFRVGDVIEVEGHLGVVKDITLRHTRILNYENRSIIIPNAHIDTAIIRNSSFPENKVCRYVEFTISYESDVEKAMQIVQEEALKHPFCIDQRTEEEKRKGTPQVRLRVLRINEQGVTIRANVWCKDADDAYDLHCDMNLTVKKRFAAEGIEIPYPHRTLVFKDKNLLQGKNSLS